MEAHTGFNFLLNEDETKNLHSYLVSTVGWLCLRQANHEKSCEGFCCICEIYKRYKKTYKNKCLTNFEKSIFIKRMFRDMEMKGDKEFPYFCTIFNNRKNTSHQCVFLFNLVVNFKCFVLVF